MTTQQMKSKWGKDYEDNYNLVKDCTAATSGLAIRYNDKYIEARYTYKHLEARFQGLQY